jgi:hypothetical protein
MENIEIDTKNILTISIYNNQIKLITNKNIQNIVKYFKTLK